MKAEEFNNFVKSLWNANTANDIAVILKDFENKLSQQTKEGKECKHDWINLQATGNLHCTKCNEVRLDD